PAPPLGAQTGRWEQSTTGNEPGPAPVPGRRPPPPVDQHAELKGRIHRACIAKLGSALYTIGSTEELATLVKDAVAEELAIDRTPLSRAERVRVQQEIADDILGYGPLEPFLRDATVTEIMVNGAEDVYIERNGRIERTNVNFTDDAHVLRIIDRIVSQVGRRVDESS